jgi:hypothetical protein
MLNEEDLEFASLIAKERQACQRALDKQAVSCVGGRRAAVARFLDSFDDSHLGVYWHDSSQAASVGRKEYHFEIALLKPGVVWIRVPTFDLSCGQKQELAVVLNRLPDYRSCKAIVFDMRGNQGGDSFYADEIIDHLYGKEYADQQRASKLYRTTFVDWRASEANFQHVKQLAMRLGHDFMKEIVEGMQASMAAKRPYYRSTCFAQKLKSTTAIIANPVRAKVFAIIEKNNVSACLDFLDQLRIMDNNACFIGQPTKADRLYMEVREVVLPSGLGIFFFPIKVWRNRWRGDKIPHMPDLPYAGDMAHTRALQKFVLKIIAGC